MHFRGFVTEFILLASFLVQAVQFYMASAVRPMAVPQFWLIFVTVALMVATAAESSAIWSGVLFLFSLFWLALTLLMFWLRRVPGDALSRRH